MFAFVADTYHFITDQLDEPASEKSHGYVIMQASAASMNNVSASFYLPIRVNKWHLEPLKYLVPEANTWVTRLHSSDDAQSRIFAAPTPKQKKKKSTFAA
jgi:hypothetical protein